MLIQVDRYNGFVIQKVVTPRGKCLGYQTKPEKGGDASLVKRFATLTQARNAIADGFAAFRSVVVKTMELTKPKSEHMQNQPGYRADNRRGGVK